MELLAAIGPYTLDMKSHIEKALPDSITVKYVTDYGQYDILKETDYILLRTLSLDHATIQTLSRAKLIQRWGAGYDTVDIKSAGEKGIPVAIAAGVNAQSVAELAVGFILSLYRNLISQAATFAQGENKRVELSAEARCIAGKTVGILGMGNVGRRVSKILQAFGADIIYYDAFRMDAEMEQKLGVSYVPIDEIWSQADIISLHLPALESTKGIVCKETLSKMKKGALLINTARQELIVEKDLAEALQKGHLAGAGLDDLAEAFPESPFAGLDRVLCTPHIGGSTIDINAAMAERCVKNILLVKAGKKLTPPTLVNAQYLADR